MHAVAAWSRISATLFMAVAGAFGSAVGGLVGGVVGATVTGTLAAMATVFAVAAHVSAVTAARAAAAAGIATAIGFGEVDVPAGVLPGAIAGGDAWAEAGRRCLSVAARGAVQIGLPAVLLGITLSGRPLPGWVRCSWPVWLLARGGEAIGFSRYCHQWCRAA